MASSTTSTLSVNLARPAIGNFIAAMKAHGKRYGGGAADQLGQTVGLALDQILTAMATPATASTTTLIEADTGVTINGVMVYY